MDPSINILAAWNNSSACCNCKYTHKETLTFHQYMCNCSYNQTTPDSDHLEQQKKKKIHRPSVHNIWVFSVTLYISTLKRSTAPGPEILVLQIPGGKKDNSEELSFRAYFVITFLFQHPSLATVGCYTRLTFGLIYMVILTFLIWILEMWETLDWAAFNMNMLFTTNKLRSYYRNV